MDHEIEKEMTLQVYAKDTFIDGITNKIHTTQASVIITVVDVNDKTPTLTTVRYSKKYQQIFNFFHDPKKQLLGWGTPSKLAIPLKPFHPSFN